MSVFLVSPNGLRTLPETLAKTTDAQRARVCVCLPSSLVRVPDRPTDRIESTRNIFLPETSRECLTTRGPPYTRASYFYECGAGRKQRLAAAREFFQ